MGCFLYEFNNCNLSNNHYVNLIRSFKKEGEMVMRLRKSYDDRVILGVCGGIAEYYNVSSFLVRILFIILPISLVAYVIMGLLLPDY
ncbi:PspC domain-containing protein [Alkalihalobacillus alcalophilus]